VKQSDRIETAHMGHEDVDDHQVEIRSVESGETVGAAVRDRNPEAVLHQPGANSQTDMQVVIDNQVQRITASLPLRFQPRPLIALILFAANQCTSLISAANSAGVCPLPGIANTYARC
jgi:hypothetical protein